MDNNHLNLQLEKAYTFFMVPFYYENDDWDVIHEERLNKWIPITEDLYNEDVLYPYIMDLFRQHSTSQNTQLDIFEFKSEDTGINSQLFVERILGKKQLALIAKNSKEKAEPKIIQFKLMNEKNFAPHLFISAKAKIGIFSFCLELLGDKRMIEDLTTLNYYLHKRNETDKYQCLCLRPDKQEDTTITTDFKSIKNIVPDLWTLTQKKTLKNVDYICWNLNDLVDCLLATMGRPKEGQKRIKYFSKDRMQLFTFCSIQDQKNSIQEKDIIPGLFRLSRCVNTNYLLPFDQLVQQGALLKTYENIFFSSSIEGASMLCIGRKDNSVFINEIHEKFNRQYLLIYLLVLIQRYTLQNLERLIIEFESTDKQSDDRLWNLIDIICRIKVNCYYTDVSIYTHHSQFYQYCCKNLHIPETFREINEKVELLKLTTDRRINELMEAQKVEKDQAERRQNTLNIIVAILTVAQVVQAVFEICNRDASSNIITPLVTGIVCLVLLIWITRKDLFKFLKKK